MRFLLLAALLILPGLDARAAVTKCFLGFATVAADDEQAPELVWATFRSLLEEVGKQGLTDKKIEELLASEDPFVFPDSTGVETLGEKLAVFKKMVEQKEWNTEPVRAAIKRNLATWRDARKRAGQKIDERVTVDGLGPRVPVEVTDPLWPTPDGKFIVSPLRKSLRIYDVATGKAHDVDLHGNVRGFGLSPDGRQVSILFDGGTVMQAPLEKGALDLSNSFELGEGGAGNVPDGSRVVHSGNRIYTSGPNVTVPQFVFEFGAWGRKPFMPGPYGKTSPRMTKSWGLIPGGLGGLPGQDGMYFVVKEPGSQEIHEVKIGNEGRPRC